MVVVLQTWMNVVTVTEVASTSASTHKDRTSVSATRDTHYDLTAVPANRVRHPYSLFVVVVYSSIVPSRKTENFLIS